MALFLGSFGNERYVLQSHLNKVSESQRKIGTLSSKVTPLTFFIMRQVAVTLSTRCGILFTPANIFFNHSHWFCTIVLLDRQGKQSCPEREEASWPTHGLNSWGHYDHSLRTSKPAACWLARQNSFTHVIHSKNAITAGVRYYDTAVPLN